MIKQSLVTYVEQFRGDDPEDDIIWIDNWNFISVFCSLDIGAEDVDKWGCNLFTIEPSDGSEEWKGYGDNFNTRKEAIDHAFIESGVWQDRDELWNQWFGYD